VGLPPASWYGPFKRALDVAVAALLLVLAAPLLLLIAAVVKLTSRGPVIYAQQRVGRGGRVYTLHKVRSMYHECERQSGPQWATAGDPRVTPVGRFLRTTHLDELPQLWNVVAGDMSLVGPRPERPVFVEQLEKVVPLYRARLLVRPGITGLAQVRLPPDSDVAGVRRKVAHDLFYVRHFGPWIDLCVLLSTVRYATRTYVASVASLLALPGVERVELAYAELVASGGGIPAPHGGREAAPELAQPEAGSAPPRRTALGNGHVPPAARSA
jgi:lipopolysaccharide/colanic/teichoic acid biosynthesis glycosyltransferase